MTVIHFLLPIRCIFNQDRFSIIKQNGIDIEDAQFVSFAISHAHFTPVPTGGCRNSIGSGTIVDGESIKIEGVRIRLDGIDAPEMKQKCWYDASESAMCGVEAKEHLSTWTEGKRSPVMVVRAMSMEDF